MDTPIPLHIGRDCFLTTKATLSTEWMKPYGLQNLKYLLFNPLHEDFVYPWYNIIRDFKREEETSSCWINQGRPQEGSASEWVG